MMNEKVFSGEVDVKYVFLPSYRDSDLLTIGFSGFHAEGAPPKYNYLNTLAEFDCHQLFILDDFGARGSYYICDNRDFKIERSVKKLIDAICKEHDIKKRISVGSSKGGSAAIYYGIKYDFDLIIAGAPQFYIGGYLKMVKSANNVLEFMAGDQTNESAEYLDNLIKDVIENKKEVLTKVAIWTGEKDPHCDTHAKPLAKLLKDSSIKHTLNFLNYSNHADIGIFFPESIKKSLSMDGLFSILDDFQMNVTGNMLKLNLKTTSEDDRVAVYLYGDDKEIIERVGYSHNREYNFYLENHNEYSLKVFVLGKEKRRYSTNLPPIVLEESTNYSSQEDSRIEPTTEINAQTLEIANLILNNQFYFRDSLDIVDFSKGIKWDYEHIKNKNAYQLQLHAFRPVSYLVNAFEVSRDITYLEKAKEIIDSWLRYEKTDHENMFVWYDHATADRAQTLAYYYLVAKSHLTLESGKFVKIIEKHADFLMDDNNYRVNNHGMMMDRALVMLGMIFDGSKAKGYTRKGVARLRDNFHHNFSYQGVHLENSPEYHVYVQEMFISVQDYLKKNKLSLGNDIIGKFKLVENYYQYITKPNGYLPMIGDSGNFKSPKKTKKYDAFYDQTAGIAIFQSENLKNSLKSTWMSFVCGFGTLTHKHYDDLSFTLFYKGRDIFVDSGRHSYGASPERNYVMTPLAHNTLAVEGYKKYTRDLVYDGTNNAALASSNIEKIGIISFNDNAIYSVVKGINYGYENIELERTILFFKPDILVIIDRACSTNGENPKILQNFNLDPEILVTNVEKNMTELQSGKDKILMRQHKLVDDAKHYTANRKNLRAVIAKKTRHLTDTNQIEFSQSGENVCFITSISLGEGIKRGIEVQYKEEHSILNIILDGVSWNLVI